ncbi:hypothetical protein ACJX0J_021167, partial [Zea mays]
ALLGLGCAICLRYFILVARAPRHGDGATMGAFGQHICQTLFGRELLDSCVEPHLRGQHIGDVGKTFMSFYSWQAINFLLHVTHLSLYYLWT